MFYLIESTKGAKIPMPFIILKARLLKKAVKEAEEKRSFANSQLKIGTDFDLERKELKNILATKTGNNEWVYIRGNNPDIKKSNDSLLKRVQVILNQQTIDIAKRLGEGNVSKAIREALTLAANGSTLNEIAEQKSDSREFSRWYFEKIIPRDQRNLIKQPECEISPDFLGFLNVYEGVKDILGKNLNKCVIIDLGCNMAAQCFMFDLAKRYIGVDTLIAKRFHSKNTEHYQCSIKDFLKNYWPGIHSETKENYLAICSYVPLNNEDRFLVQQSFNNLLMYTSAK